MIEKGVKPDGMYNDISWKEGILWWINDHCQKRWFRIRSLYAEEICSRRTGRTAKDLPFGSGASGNSASGRSDALYLDAKCSRWWGHLGGKRCKCSPCCNDSDRNHYIESESARCRSSGRVSAGRERKWRNTGRNRRRRYCLSGTPIYKKCESRCRTSWKSAWNVRNLRDEWNRIPGSGWDLVDGDDRRTSLDREESAGWCLCCDAESVRHGCIWYEGCINGSERTYVFKGSGGIYREGTSGSDY